MLNAPLQTRHTSDASSAIHCALSNCFIRAVPAFDNFVKRDMFRNHKRRTEAHLNRTWPSWSLVNVFPLNQSILTDNSGVRYGEYPSESYDRSHSRRLGYHDAIASVEPRGLQHQRIMRHLECVNQPVVACVGSEPFDSSSILQGLAQKAGV